MIEQTRSMRGVSCGLASLTLVLALGWSAAAKAQPVAASERTGAAGSVRPRSAVDELSELERQRASMRLELPAILTVVGGSALLIGAVAYRLSDLCAIGDSETACDKRDSIQSTALIIGVSGALVGIAGLAWLVHGLGERRALSARIKALKAARSAELAWSAYLDRERFGASVQLPW
jgi:hypothetical protein